MSEKFRLDRKIHFRNMFYTKCINVIIDSIGPSIILRSLHIHKSNQKRPGQKLGRAFCSSPLSLELKENFLFFGKYQIYYFTQCRKTPIFFSALNNI